jgi:hypothetical protein
MPGRRCFRCGSNLLPLYETATGAVLCRHCLRYLPTDAVAGRPGRGEGAGGALAAEGGQK